MKIRFNSFLVNSLIVTLAILFSTLMFLSQMRSEVLQQATSLLGIFLIAFVWKILQGRLQEEARLKDVARILSETTGDSYFPSLVENLSRLLQAEFAFIGELAGENQDTIRVIAAFGKGKPVEPFSYRLAGTPCAEVVTGELRFYPEGVARRYPNNRLLDEISAEGFLGMPLKLADGRVVGILVVLDSKPLRTQHDTEPIFRLFAVRAAAELEHLRNDISRREMADRIRLITDSVPVNIAYVDEELRYQFVNRGYEEWFDLPRKEIVGRSIEEMRSPADFARIRGQAEKALAGERVTFVNEHVRRDGSIAFLLASYVPHLVEDRVVGFFVLVNDITASRKAEESIRASEERYRTVFNTTGAATFISDEDTTVSLVNEEFIRLSGYTRKEVEGLLSWTAFVTPESSEKMLGYHHARRLDPASAPHAYECEAVWRDGSLRNMMAHVNVIPGTGQSIISFLDITGHKKLEAGLQRQLAFLQTLIDTIPSPVFYKDRAGHFTGCNLAFSKYLGRNREELVGKTVYDLAPKDLADRYSEMDEELFTNPGVQVYDASVIYADGSRHEVTLNKATFSSTNGQIDGLVGVIIDLTERKKAESMLAEREAFLSNIIDSIQDGISILDEELRVIRVNPVMERWLSNRGPLVGRICHEAYNGRSEPCEPCPALETLKTGKPGFKIYSKPLNNSVRWLEIYTYPLYDPQTSHIAGVIENIRDVTERKWAEDAVIAAEEKFRSLVEQSLVGTYIIQDGNFVYVNPKMAEIFGYTREELTAGMSHLDLTAVQDKPLAAENVRRRNAGEIQSVQYEFQGLRKDGTKNHIEVYGTSIEYEGKPAIIGTLLDVTARSLAQEALRESEERFHQLFVQSGDAIILIRLDNFSIIDANPAAQELFQYGHAELVSLLPSELIGQKGFAALINAIPQSDSAAVFQFDRAEGIQSNGTRVTIAIRCKILRLREEYIIHCSIRDITEKVQLEEDIRNAQAKLIHANKMTSIGMLASSVAHEINNPNNCISVNAAMLVDVWKDAEPLLKTLHEEQGEFMLRGIPFTRMQEFAPRLLDGIREGSRRITAIVQNMKDYVREDKSGCHGSIDINQLLQNAIAILWHNIHIYTDNFTTELDESLPPARGNGQQLEQVLINLITNALQALTDKGSGVHVTTGIENGENIIIKVRDEGKGMDETTLARLTEPFFTTRTADGGTGLGLYISESILKEHEGTLEFQSEPGTGTTAICRLPLAEVRV